MTTTGIGVERGTKGSQRRPASRAMSLSVASGETDGILGVNGAGKSTAASRHRGGGQLRVCGLDPAEQWTPVRHLVIFPARIV